MLRESPKNYSGSEISRLARVKGREASDARMHLGDLGWQLGKSAPRLRSAAPAPSRYHTYVKRVFSLLLLAPWLGAADHWVSVRSGPFQILSSAGDRPAREQMMQLEQLRNAIGVVLGKQELQLVWPVRILLEKRPPASPPDFPLGRDAYMGAIAENGGIGASQRKALTRLLIDQNTKAAPGRNRRRARRAVLDTRSKGNAHHARRGRSAGGAHARLGAHAIAYYRSGLRRSEPA